MGGGAPPRVRAVPASVSVCSDLLPVPLDPPMRMRLQGPCCVQLPGRKGKGGGERRQSKGCLKELCREPLGVSTPIWKRTPSLSLRLQIRPPHFLHSPFNGLDTQEADAPSCLATARSDNRRSLRAVGARN